MNGDNCSLCDRCANKGIFLCVDDAYNCGIGCFRNKIGNGTKLRRKDFEKIEKRWRERVHFPLSCDVQRTDGD